MRYATKCLYFSSSTIQKLPQIPESYTRFEHKYDLVDIKSDPTGMMFTYTQKSCRNEDVAYSISFLEVKPNILTPVMYSPSNLCTDPVCLEPAGKLTVIGEDGKPINPEEDPTVYMNEEETFADIFFPRPNTGYIVTGVRNDVYQVFSSEFTAINIPIKKGMVHRYILDREAKKRGAKNWIRILIDSDSNGVYDDEYIVGGEMITGPDFLNQCARSCIGMEKF